MCSNCNSRGWLKSYNHITTCPRCLGSKNASLPSPTPIKYAATYDYGVMSEAELVQLKANLTNAKK